MPDGISTYLASASLSFKKLHCIAVDSCPQRAKALFRKLRPHKPPLPEFSNSFISNNRIIFTVFLKNSKFLRRVSLQRGRAAHQHNLRVVNCSPAGYRGCKAISFVVPGAAKTCTVHGCVSSRTASYIPARGVFHEQKPRYFYPDPSYSGLPPLFVSGVSTVLILPVPSLSFKYGDCAGRFFRMRYNLICSGRFHLERSMQHGIRRTVRLM